MKKRSVVTMVAVSAVLMAGCSVDPLADDTAGSDENSGSEESVAQESAAITAIANGTCATHYQLAAEVMRAAMIGLGRYRPGLDLVKGPYGAMQLVQTTAAHPDLDGDGGPDGLQRCIARGGCPELISLLNLQNVDYQTQAALAGEFPWMSVFQPGEMRNSLSAGISDQAYPNYNQVVHHVLTFDHISTAVNQYTAGCGGDFKYHCFKVSGLPSGYNITNLKDQMTAVLMNDNIKSLTHLIIENNTLCIDPDGGGGDATTVGATGAATCMDGTQAVSYDDGLLGACCTKNNNTGILVRHPTVSSYLVCKVTDAARYKTAITDSSDGANPAPNGNDGNINTRWRAADTNPNHYWTVDLGASMTMKGALLTLEQPGLVYGYRIETSLDNATWTVKADRTSNPRILQFQDAAFTTTARYARVYFTSLPAGKPAAVAGFSVFTD